MDFFFSKETRKVLSLSLILGNAPQERRKTTWVFIFVFEIFLFFVFCLHFHSLRVSVVFLSSSLLCIFFSFFFLFFSFFFRFLEWELITYLQLAFLLFYLNLDMNQKSYIKLSARDMNKNRQFE